MKVSVIIPTHNRKDLLKGCLKSLFNQDFNKQNYEIIVVNDGSKDNTEWYLKGIKHNNFRHIEQKNKGPASARNLGVKYCKGKIIAFLDDDCIVDKDWIRSIVNNFERFPKAGAIGSGIINIFKNKLFSSLTNFEREGALKQKKIEVYNKLNPNNRISSANCAIKKDIFLKVDGFNKKFKYFGEDPDFWYRLIKKGYTIYKINNFTVYHHEINSVVGIMKKYFLYGLTDVNNYKNHFKKNLFIDFNPILNKTILVKFPFTLSISKNVLLKVLLIAILLFFLNSVISIILSILTVLIVYLKTKKMTTTIQFFLWGLITQIPNFLGRGLGSIKNKVIVI